MNKTEDNIDLLKLFSAGYKIVAKKKAILISIALLTTFGCAIYLVNNSPNKENYFKKNYLLQSGEIPNDVMVEILNSINLKLKFENRKNSDYKATLAKELDVTESQLAQVKKVSFSIKPPNLIEMSVEAYSKDVFDSLIMGMEKFVHRNEYVKKREQLNVYQKEQFIHLYDSMVTNGFHTISNDDESKITDQKISRLSNMATKFERLNYIEIFAEKLKFEKELQFSNELQVVVPNYPFESFNVPLEIAMKSVAAGLFASVVTILLILLRSFMTKLKSIY